MGKKPARPVNGSTSPWGGFNLSSNLSGPNEAMAGGGKTLGATPGSPTKNKNSPAKSRDYFSIILINKTKIY